MVVPWLAHMGERRKHLEPPQLSEKDLQLLGIVIRSPGQTKYGVRSIAKIGETRVLSILKFLQALNLIEARIMQQSTQGGRPPQGMYATPQGMALWHERTGNPLPLSIFSNGEDLTKRKMQGGKTDCGHSWKIAPAENPISQGVCQNCGGVRYFRNSFHF